MKKTMIIYTFSLLVMLVGCNTRQPVTEVTLNGTYELVDFISSNINIGEPVHNPYTDDYQRVIHIEENAVTIRDMNYTNQTEQVYDYTIIMNYGYYIDIENTDTKYVQRIYTDAKAGILEIMENGTETKHFIFSKYEQPDQTLIPNGTYEIYAAFGVAYGQLVKPEVWTQFDLKINGSKISFIRQVVGEAVERSEGNYRGGVIAIMTNMGDHDEYLEYDPSEKTLTYTEKFYSFSQPELNRDYYYIFKLKS